MGKGAIIHAELNRSHVNMICDAVRRVKDRRRSACREYDEEIDRLTKMLREAEALKDTPNG